MPFIKIYIHLVWSTKNRVPYLRNSDLRNKLWLHIRENAKLKDIYIDTINGYEDHCHCLLSLGSDQTIQKVAQLIKGESSFWINKQNVLEHKLEWQEHYFAVSISESMIEKVRHYINNQEAHHQHKTFEAEYNEFISKYGFNGISAK